MNDRELLELAAKAAGVQIATWSNCQAGGFQTQDSAQGKFWNPLTDDGDAFRLAVKLSLQISTSYCGTRVYASRFDEAPYSAEIGVYDLGGYAATRRAIVMAAADRASL